MTAPRHTRFEAIRLRLEAYDPGTGWRLWLYEFLLFGLKQAWACLFGGLMLVAVAAGQSAITDALAISLDVLSCFDPLGNAVHTALSFDLVGEDGAVGHLRGSGFLGKEEDAFDVGRRALGRRRDGEVG